VVSLAVRASFGVKLCARLVYGPRPMAIEHLTEEQIRTWTREQKDRWWRDNVYRGDMPQLTLRAALTGFCLGGILSATNLYVGAKTGWTLGVGITSVILAFSMFKILSRFGAKDMTILENNAMQSVATSAGYMTMPLVSGMTAYMWVENTVIPWWQMMLFCVVLSILGVLVAFPMKRRFINDEQQPFPEGRACGVVLDTLYSSDESVGFFKARALAIAAAGAGLFSFVSGEYIQTWLQTRLLGLKSAWHLRTHLDYYLFELLQLPAIRLAGVDIRQLGLSPAVDLAMIGAGGLMGIRPAASMLLGMLLNFVVIVPIMISLGEIAPRADGTFSRVHVVNSWALWWGISIMVVASLTSLFAKPKVILSAFTGMFTKSDADPARSDVLRDIELPIWVSVVGVPVVGVLGVWMTHAWFGVSWGYGLVALPLIIVLSLIAANSTALTGITPSSALSKLPQFLFGSLDPKHPPTNLMTALMSVEVASNASNLLMDIKPGYMLGAKPRQQAVGHVIGIFAGALAATPLFNLLFLSDLEAGKSMQDAMMSDQFSFPSALQWKGVSDLVSAVFSEGRSPIATSALWSVAIAAVAGLVLEVTRIASHNRFPVSGLGIGLGVVLPPESTIAMFAGSAFFWVMQRRHGARPESREHQLWIGTQEPICAGLIAGAALVGIADILVKVFLLR
jgi:OPT family oligopeptide transporter